MTAQSSLAGKAFFVTLVGLFVASATPALGQTSATWSGGGTTADWSDVSNWDILPTAGAATSLTFGTAGVSGTTLNIDLTNGIEGQFTLNTIRFLNATTSSYTFGGNDLVFAGANNTISMTNATGAARTQTFNMANIFIGSAAGLTVVSHSNAASNTAAIIINSNISSTMATATTLTIGGPNSTITLNGTISDGSGGGSLRLTKTDAGVLVLNGTDNSFSGPVEIRRGTIQAASIASSGANSSLGAGNQLIMGSTTLSAVLNVSSALTSAAVSFNREIVLAGTTGNAFIQNLNTNTSATILINGTISVTGAGTKILVLGGNNTGLNEMSSALANNSGANRTGLQKQGGVNSFWYVSNEANSFTGTVTIAGGTLRATAQGASINLANNNLVLRALTSTGGILETSGTLTNSLGTGVNQIRWANFTSTQAGSGGFSAFGGVLNVTLNNDAAAPLVWGATANFTTTLASAAGELQFGSIYSDNVVFFNNAMDFGDAARTVRVFDNSATTDDYAVLTGVLSSGVATGGLTKAGAGTLVITNSNNTYQGGTTVSGGVLVVGHDSALGAGTLRVGGGALAAANGARTLTNELNLAGTVLLTGTEGLTLAPTSGIAAVVAGSTITNDIGAGASINGDVNLLANLGFAGTNTMTINGTLLVSGAARTVTNNVSGQSLGNINLAGDGSAWQLDFRSGNNTTTLNLNGVISDGGLGGMVRYISGVNVIANANTYSGSTHIFGGSPIVLANDAAFGTGTVLTLTAAAGPAMLEASALRTLANDITLSTQLTLTGDHNFILNGTITTSGSRTLSLGTAITATLGGNVVLGDAAAARALTLASAEAGTFVVSGTVQDGPIAPGALSISMTGGGSVVLSGNNSHSGVTTLSAGSLLMSHANAFGTGTLRLNGGTFDSGAVDRTISNPVALGGTVTLTGGGTVFLSSGLSSVAAASVLSLSSAGGVTYSNGVILAANLTTEGAAFAAYGLSQVTAATVLTMNNSAVTFSNLQLGGNLSLAGGVTPAINGLVSLVGGNRTLSVNNTGGLTLGNIALGSDGTGRALTLAGSGPIVINGAIADGPAGDGRIAVAGGALVTMNGVNTYTGPTTISNGTLRYTDFGQQLGTSRVVFAATSGTQAVLETSGTLTAALGTLAGQISWSATAGGGFAARGGALNVTLNNDAVTPIIWTVAGTGFNGGELQLSSDTADNTVTINNSISTGTQAARTIRVFDGSASIDAIITGALVHTSTTGAITKQGAGTLQLLGTNTYAGTTTIAGGTLIVGDGASAGSLPNNRAVHLNAGTTFNYDRTGVTLTQSAIQGGGTVNISFTGGNLVVTNFTHTGNNTIISGTMTVGTGTVATFGAPAVTINPNAALRFSTTGLTVNSQLTGGGLVVIGAGNTTFVGDSDANTDWRLAGGSAVLTIGDGATTGSGTILGDIAFTTTTNILIFNRPDDITYSGSISGTFANGQVRKLQSNVVELAGTSTYTVGTSVVAGTLRVTGTLGNSAITVGAGATFEVASTGRVINTATRVVTINDLGNIIISGTMGTGTGTLNGGANLRGIGGVTTATWTVNGGNVIVGEDSGPNQISTLTLGGLIMNNAALFLDIQTAVGDSSSFVGGLADRIISTSLPTVTVASTVNVNGLSGFGVGYYLLMSGYSGSMNTSLLTFNTPTGFKKTIHSVNGQLILELLEATSRTWVGNLNGNWDDLVTANWAGNTTYDNTDRDAVIFDDTAVGTTSINIVGPLQPTSVLVNNSAVTYTFVGDAIGGDTGIVKQGTGTLVLLNENTFSGGVISGGGTVQIGNGGAAGSVLPTVGFTLDDGSNLIFDGSDEQTLGSISGTGNLIKNGTGTLKLGGSNNYVGLTSVNAGALETTGAALFSDLTQVHVNDGAQFNIRGTVAQVIQQLNVTNSSALSVETSALTATTLRVNYGQLNVAGSSLSAPNVTMTGGVINLTGGNATFTNVTWGGLTDTSLAPTVDVVIDASRTLTVTGSLTFTGNNAAATDSHGVAINGAGAFSTANRAITFAINDSANTENEVTISTTGSNNFSFVKTGGGTLYLQAANVATTNLGLNGGTLRLGHDSALGSGTLTATSGTISADSSPRTLANNINVRGTVTITGTQGINFNGIVTNAGGSRTLIVNNNTTIGTLRLSEGVTNRAMTLAGTGSVTINLLSQNTSTSGQLIVQGSGLNVILAGSSVYDGTTFIRGGTVMTDVADAFGTGTVPIITGTTNGSDAVALLFTNSAGLNFARDIRALATAGSEIDIGSTTAVTTTLSGNLTLSQMVGLRTVVGGTLFISGSIAAGSAAGAFTVTGGGNVVLGGDNSGYAGIARVGQGTLFAGATTALRIGSTLQIDAGTAFDLNGFDVTVGTLTEGLGTITNNGAAATLTVGAGQFTGTIAGGANLRLVKATTGTLTLAGMNTYAGATTVVGGALLVTGTLANTAGVAVESGGILGGTGVIAATVTSTGTISPGTSVGTLSIGHLVLNGGSVSFELGTPAASDKIIITGGAAPVVTDTTNLSFTTLADFDEGTYNLITGYGLNTIAGIGNLVVPSTINGLNATLQNNGGSLDLVVAATQLFWTGAGTDWDLTTANWTGDATLFTTTASVTFTDTANRNIAVEAGGVGAYKVTVTNGSAFGYTFAGGAINGDRLIKDGDGSLALSNANSYVRGVTINNGELVVGDGTTNGSLVGNVLNNALLTFNRSDAYTFAGNISGTGALQQNGTGTLILTGDNSFTGPTTVNFGFLDVRGNYASTIYNNTGVQVTVASNTTGTVAFTAPIVGNVTFQQNGSGVTTLSGANTFTGTTQVNAGTLVIGNSLNGTESVAVNSSGTLQVAGGASVTTPGAITVVGTANFTSSTNVPGTLVVNGTVNAPSGVTVGQGGVVKGTGTVNGPLVIGDGGALSPGNSVGAIGGTNLSLTGGSTLVFEFRDASGLVDFNGGDPGGTGAGFGWDLIDLGSGLIDLGDASASDPIFIRVDAWALDNSAHDSGAGGAIFDPNSSYEWLFVKTDGTPLPDFDFPPDDDLSRRFVVIDDANNLGVFGTNNAFTRPSSSVGQGTFRVAFGNYGGQGNGLYITYSAIPEPGSMILAGLASLGAGWYGRRRMRKKDESAGVAA